MKLRDKLMEDFKVAMKAKDEISKKTISFARAAIKQVEVDERKELEDDEIIAILTKQIKMRKDAILEFEKAGREDLTMAYKEEMEVLQRYVPEQLTTEEIDKVVSEEAQLLGITGGKENMGKLMGKVMSRLKNVADGNDVRQAVMKFLG